MMIVKRKRNKIPFPPARYHHAAAGGRSLGDGWEVSVRRGGRALVTCRQQYTRKFTPGEGCDFFL